MSRSGYSDDCDNYGLWRGAVERSMNGKRGQAFLREMLASLDALPEKKLIKDDLVDGTGAVCAIGSVGLRRGLDMSSINIDDAKRVAEAFGIAHAMAAEIEYLNDECGFSYPSTLGGKKFETPEERFTRIRAWVVGNIVPTPEEVGSSP
jgi:hypothetical protein